MTTTHSPSTVDVDSSSQLEPSSHCGPEQFQCDNKQCIESTKYCDRIIDCPDLSDEVNCPPHVCESGQFQCDSGTCIDESLKCNNAYDCPDASDELDCESGPFCVLVVLYSPLCNI